MAKMIPPTNDAITRAPFAYLRPMPVIIRAISSVVLLCSATAEDIDC